GGRGGGRQESRDARGSPGAVGEQAESGGYDAEAASAAAGVDRPLGAALRLLPERNADPGGGSAGDEQESDEDADPDGTERPPVPLWDVSEDRERSSCSCGGDESGGRGMKRALNTPELSPKRFLTGSGALVLRLARAGGAPGSDQ